jgi:hypothetical protein
MSEAGIVNRTLLLAAVILFTATGTQAVWRGPPQMVAALDPESRDWVQALKNQNGVPCCDTADGFPVEVDGWDMAGTVETYRKWACGRPGTLGAAIVFG